MIKIISGGQTGVDIAALRAARRTGFQTGGTMPFGFYTEAGHKPEYEKEFGMVQMPPMKSLPAAYVAWTRANVANSEVTIIIATRLNSAGTIATDRAVRDAGHYSTHFLIAPGSCFDLSVPEKFSGAVSDLTLYFFDLLALGVQCVNIAGNRDVALEAPVEELLFQVFTSLKAGKRA